MIRPISAVLAALAVGLTAQPVAAVTTPAPQGRIGQVAVTGTGLTFPFSATRRAGQGVEALQLRPQAEVTVTPLGGPSYRADVTVQSRVEQTTVMLALDTSGSMARGNRFAAEKAAALEFVRGLRAGVRIGLVTFGVPAEVVLEPTEDHARVAEQISALRTAGDTALFQAITVAAQRLPRSGHAVLVVVTDGDQDLEDGSQSRAELALSARQEAAARAVLSEGGRAARGITFRGVIIGDEAAGRDLARVAPPGSVRVDRAGGTDSDVAEDLRALFAESSEAVERTVTVDAALPSPATSGVVTIAVTARTVSGEIVRSNAVRLLGPPAATDPTDPDAVVALPPGTRVSTSLIGTPVLLAALGALFLAGTVLVASATGALSSGRAQQQSAVAQALTFYTVRGNRPEAVAGTQHNGTQNNGTQHDGRLTRSRWTRGLVNLMAGLARQRNLDRALDARLEAAGLPLRTAEWMLLHVGTAIGTALLLLVAARGLVVAGVIGLLLGLLGPWMFLSLRTGMRERTFLAQLPDTLQLLAGSLAAGYSLPQAMDAVLREARPPISVEFSRALIETRLGMPPEDALEGIATRTGSRDFSWIVMAIRIQRDVGGNLAELLATVAGTLRERERLRRQVSALSAEGRLSGVILSALPIVFAIFLTITKPTYIAPLFETPLGWLLLATGSALMLVGGFWMSRVVKVQV